MTWLGISPDSVSISAVIDGYFKAGQSEEAISILNIFIPPLSIFLDSCSFRA
jgi:pentatricopeptide repeat protein